MKSADQNKINLEQEEVMCREEDSWMRIPSRRSDDYQGVKQFELGCLAVEWLGKMIGKFGN